MDSLHITNHINLCKMTGIIFYDLQIPKLIIVTQKNV